MNEPKQTRFKTAAEAAAHLADDPMVRWRVEVVQWQSDLKGELEYPITPNSLRCRLESIVSNMESVLRAMEDDKP